MSGPRETIQDEDLQAQDDGGWDADRPDEAEVQYGARFEDLTEEDQRLLTMAENRAAFDTKKPAELPQPSRAQSVRGLPKVKSGVFPRLLK
ncbi:MAG: hypothetical protein U0228_26530 [Myxococcaceae bacterium]